MDTTFLEGSHVDSSNWKGMNLDLECAQFQQLKNKSENTVKVKSLHGEGAICNQNLRQRQVLWRKIRNASCLVPMHFVADKPFRSRGTSEKVCPRHVTETNFTSQRINREGLGKNPYRNWARMLRKIEFLACSRFFLFLSDVVNFSYDGRTQKLQLYSMRYLRFLARLRNRCCWSKWQWQRMIVSG